MVEETSKSGELCGNVHFTAVLIDSRETIKRLLAFPSDTNIVWKSHDDSIAQRSALDQARLEKSAGTGPHHVSGKRREPASEDPIAEKSKSQGS